ncbi:MAG: hypothetical protein ACRDTT_16045, partial [Pseudonocardiaceae bacterium]
MTPGRQHLPLPPVSFHATCLTREPYGIQQCGPGPPKELTQRYLCSSGVARKAIDLLRQQGLVVSKQGKGVFVRERARPKRHGIDRYARSRWKQGGTAIHDAEAGNQGQTDTQLYRELGEVPAPPAVAAAFGVECQDAEQPGKRVPATARRNTRPRPHPHRLRHHRPRRRGHA